MAKKLKIKKEQPRFKVQSEYEGKFKRNYAQMLNNMNKELIHRLTQNISQNGQEK